jgi:hypothetical protein
MQLLPNLEPYVALLERELAAPAGPGPAGGGAPRPSPLRRQEAARCFGALLAASAGAMYHRVAQRRGPWPGICSEAENASAFLLTRSLIGPACRQ